MYTLFSLKIQCLLYFTVRVIAIASSYIFERVTDDFLRESEITLPLISFILLHPLGGAKFHLPGWRKEGPLRVNPERSTSF